MDPTIVRLIVVILAFISFGTAIIVYIAAAFIMPDSAEFSDDDDISHLKKANISEEEEKKSSAGKENDTSKGHSNEDFDKYFDEK